MGFEQENRRVVPAQAQLGKTELELAATALGGTFVRIVGNPTVMLATGRPTASVAHNKVKGQEMAKPKIETVRELIYYSYANLAMAHSAVENNQDTYGIVNFSIRAKLFKGLKDGSMSMRTIFDDEKIKIQTGQICNYCGATDQLAMDHIFPKQYGGQDNAENLICACKRCNSSKGKRDLVEWMIFRKKFLPLMIIRRYLKLTFRYCIEHDLIDRQVAELKCLELPFKIELLPTTYPKPCELTLNIE